MVLIKLKSPVHLSIGQESIAVGVSLALEDNDIVFSNYRGHAHYIAKGGNFNKMWAELFGKSRGTARGKGGSMHLNDWSKKFMSTSAIVGTSVPEAVGYAYALKYKDEKGSVICYLGDGATEEGVFGNQLTLLSCINYQLFLYVKIINMQSILISPEDLLVMRYLKKPNLLE